MEGQEAPHLGAGDLKKAQLITVEDLAADTSYAPAHDEWRCSLEHDHRRTTTWTAQPSGGGAETREKTFSDKI